MTDFNRYNPVKGGIMISQEGSSLYGTLGIVLLDTEDNARKFLLTAFNLFTPWLLVKACRVFQPLDCDLAPRLAGMSDPRELCDWSHPNLGDPNGPVRQPNLLGRMSKDDPQDCIAVELDPEIDAEVGRIEDIGDVRPPEGLAPRGTEVLVRGAESSTVRTGTVEGVSINVELPGGYIVRNGIGVNFTETGPRMDVPLFVEDGDAGSVVVVKNGSRALGLLSGTDPGTGLSLVVPLDHILRDCNLMFP